jgi:hypothetical protein
VFDSGARETNCLGSGETTSNLVKLFARYGNRADITEVIPYHVGELIPGYNILSTPGHEREISQEATFNAPSFLVYDIKQSQRIHI